MRPDTTTTLIVCVPDDGRLSAYATWRYFVAEALRLIVTFSLPST
jgi:hypothetical protein